MVGLKFLNTRGFPALESKSVVSNNLGDTIITFNNHPYINTSFAGGFWVKIGQPLASSSDGILFNTEGISNSEVRLYLPNGNQAAASNLVSDGNAVHMCFYDSDNKRLILIA